MILLVLMAIIGAVTGAWFRPRLAAPLLAIALAAAARAAIGLSAPIAVGAGAASGPAALMLGIIENPLDDYGPLLAAAGCGAIIAAGMGMIIDRRRPDVVTPGEASQVRRRVTDDRKPAVDAGAARDKAEARQKAVLGL